MKLLIFAVFTLFFLASVVAPGIMVCDYAPAAQSEVRL